MLGSGQFGTPWERMHRANSARRSAPAAPGLRTVAGLSHCWSELALSDPPLAGIRCWQALWAAWSWVLLTPSSCAVAFGGTPLVGSGKFGTPWERMQWE